MIRRIILSKSAAVLLIVFATLILSTNAFAMFKVCLFSPVKGKVVLNGQPVVGAVIERTYDWAWKSQKGRDETKTDQNGEFSLPAIYGTMILGSVLPHEPSINQEILIKWDGKSFGAWYSFKRDYAEYGELGGALNGQPINLLCDLEKKVTNHGEYGGIGELRTIPEQP